MKHILFADADQYPVAVLIKGTAFNKQELLNNYVIPLETKGVTQDSCIAFDLQYNSNGKVSVKEIKEYLATLLLELQTLGTTHLYVADANYFKTLTKKTKAEPYHGYVLPCAIPGFEHMQVVLGINYQALIYNPDLQTKLNTSLEALIASLKGNYQAPGSGIVHSAQYPKTLQEIAAALESLHQYSSLTCDIEAFSLRFEQAGIGTIAFAWDEHNGVAFPCDAHITNGTAMEGGNFKLYQSCNTPVRALLLKFFLSYKGELIWHNATYDLKVIIYTLWMQSLLDTEGLLTGLETMTKSFQDTKIIAYLATNSTAGNVLGLKALAHEFAGNWAVEVNDIRFVPLDKLLQYNLVDALCTWYVKKKYSPIMLADLQEEIYENMMKPSLKTIIQIELTGMPLNPKKVQEVKQRLEEIQATHLNTLQNSPVIKTLDLLVQTKAMETANSKLKIKQHPLSAFSDIRFNPNSGPQLQRLLYELMALPVIDTTDTGMPATGAETLEKLINHAQQADYKEILQALISYGQATKILSTFIPAFERALAKGDGIVWLHGCFNLGGTVSGRLSSSDPNLQNLPAGNTGSAEKQLYGKLIKSCFEAPTGWLFAGADFNSLEDMISALTTKDKNKLKVYTDGYCGHCLRAYSYFKDELPEVRQATDNERCFSIEVNGQLLLCKSGDFIKLESGETILIEDYFDTYS